MKYYGAILVVLVAITMPQIEAGAADDVSIIHQHVVKAQNDFSNYKEELTEKIQTVHDDLLRLARNMLEQASTILGKENDNSGFATLKKLRSVLEESSPSSLLERCVVKTMNKSAKGNKYKTIIRDLHLLIDIGDNIERTIKDATAKCISLDNSDKCIQPKLAEFKIYAKRYNRSHLNVQADIKMFDNLKGPEPVDVLKCISSFIE